jgi:uncharacterized protein YbjT (DUF2867 family)
MNASEHTILVTGATGHQGGAVARHLLKDGWKVRALVRDTQKPTAQALLSHGAELVQGDLGDAPSLQRALQGVYGVFSVQGFMEQGVEGEIRQGKLLAELAQRARVQHFVYSSVGGADRRTGVPHFESKWQIEEYLRTLDMPCTVVRPVFFMENFVSYFPPQRENGVLTLALGLPAERPLQMVAVDDIGAFVALALSRPEGFVGRAIDLAGDDLPMSRVVELWSSAAGEPVQYYEVPLENVRAFSEEIAEMYEWFDRVGFDFDIAAVKRLLPGLKSFEQWISSAVRRASDAWAEQVVVPS